MEEEIIMQFSKVKEEGDTEVDTKNGSKEDYAVLNIEERSVFIVLKIGVVFIGNEFS